MKTYPFVLAAVLAAASCERPTESAPPAASESAAAPYPLEVCLVSGEELGSMGEPVVIVHDGREIRFCCDSCEPKFRADPAKFLSKLENP